MCNFGFWFKNTKSCACLFFQCVFVAKVVNKTYFAGKEWLSDATLPIFNPTSLNLYQPINLLLINDFYYPKIILEFWNQLSFFGSKNKKVIPMKQTQFLPHSAKNIGEKWGRSGRVRLESHLHNVIFVHLLPLLTRNCSTFQLFGANTVKIVPGEIVLWT